MALTMASTPLKLLRSCSTIIISTARETIATLSSKFSASTIVFSSHLVNYKKNIHVKFFWRVDTIIALLQLKLTFVVCLIIFKRFGDVFSLSFLVHTDPTNSEGFTVLYNSNSNNVNCLANSMGWSCN